MYVCAQLDGLNCLQWVERAYLLPPLSVEEGASLGGAFLTVYIVAWGFNVVVRQIINHW